MLGTQLCDCCYKLELRIKAAPDLAERILEGLGHVTKSHQQDIWEFQEKFGQILNINPRHLTKRKLYERIECMHEELVEFWEAAEIQDLAGQADALIDLVYFAIGTANMLGLPWQELWNDVQRANMAKERGVGKRGHLVDCVKPDGWKGPVTMEILVAAGYDEERHAREENWQDDPEHVS